MKVLLVANQTLASRKVFERVLWLHEGHPGTHFHVVVPVTPSESAPRVKEDIYGRPVVDHVAVSAANARLVATLSSIRAMGVSADGELGHANPVQAARFALSRNDYSRVILATLPAGASRWLRMDAIHRISRVTDVPVDHIEGDVEPPTARAQIETWHSVGVADARESIDVLIIDDNDADIELTKIALERAPVACNVHDASDGTAGLEKARLDPPDLALLDISMPGISGFDVLAAWGEEQTLAGVPVIILSTSDRPADRERAHELGAAAYIVKENDFSKFEDVLAGLLAEVAFA